MNVALRSQAQAPQTTSVEPSQSSFVQRKCACGGSAGLADECSDCDKKKFTLQRSSLDSGAHTAPNERVPQIVHDALNSPGRPLDLETRAYMEPRFNSDAVRLLSNKAIPQRATTELTVGPANDEFEHEADYIAGRVLESGEHGSQNHFPLTSGYDFSRVRVHTDDYAAKSAKAIGALAYTLGDDIIFGSGKFAPATESGRRLLAHELTHVVQQSHNLNRARLQRSVGGFFRNIFINVPVFGFLLHFSQNELNDYLKKLDQVGMIENDDDSDNKAVEIARSWNRGEGKFVLTARRKALLILEMLSGWVSDDDEESILGLLERADNPELEYIFGEGQVKHEKILTELKCTRTQLYRFYRRRYSSAYPELTIEELTTGGAPPTKPDLAKLKDAEPVGFSVQRGDKLPETTNAFYSAIKTKETKRRTELITKAEADSWINEVYGQFLPKDKVKMAGEKKGFSEKNVPLRTESGGTDDPFESFIANCLHFEMNQMTAKQRQNQNEMTKARDKCNAEERNVAGFFDAESNDITVRTDRESPSTRLHEVIHAYAESSVNGKLTRYAMEGLTEYLTRQIIARHKLDKDEKRLPISQSYGGPHDAIVELSLIVGDAALAKAHFQGDVEGLSQLLGKDVFEKWLEMMKESSGWQDAVKLLRNRKTDPKTKVQKKADNQTELSDALVDVNEVLRTSGQSLDGETRAFMEPRFGHDFSTVRIHADERSAVSAQSVNAVAYTVGENIVFGSGMFAPATTAGRHLLAHELTHVLQQRTGLDQGPPQARLRVGRQDDSYEKEADRLANSIVDRSADSSTSLTAQSSSSQLVQRQPPPPASPPVVAPVAPTQTQQTVIEAARVAAAIRSQIALHRVTGIVPPGPPGRPDPAQQMRQRAISLARKMFNWANPNMEQIEEIVSHIVSRLSNPQVMVAGSGDIECGSRAAYVRGLQPPIILCPTFFTDTPEEQVRTMIHEAAHLAQIGSAGLAESYCVIFDCETSCGGFESADSWAQFIHCLSGQTPDQPPVFQGQPPGKTPPAGGGGTP